MTIKNIRPVFMEIYMKFFSSTVEF